MTDKNIQQFVGEKQNLTFTIENDDGNIIDLTGSDVQNVYLDVATGLAKYGETKFEKTGDDLSQDGTVDFVIESADTENLKTGNYLYEVWVEFSGSSNYTAEVGKFFIKPRVDR